MEFQLSTNAGKIAQRFSDGSRTVLNLIAVAMHDTGEHLKTVIVQRKLSGSPIRRRTGNLQRAIHFRTRRGPTYVTLTVAPDLRQARYGRILDVGGTIRATRAQFLTIPVGRNLTGAGIGRMSARAFIANPEALGFTRSFVNPRKTAIMGALAGGGWEPVFALKKSVRIPAFGYLQSVIPEERSWIEERFQQVVDELSRELGQ